MEDKPCQDASLMQSYENGWGIAIVADGAGSCTHSDEGSTLAVKLAEQILGAKVNEWSASGRLPSEVEWRAAARITLGKIYEGLKDYAEQNAYSTIDLSCTVIILVYSPYGLLVTHIGDGRAGYCTPDEKWRSCMVPFHGEHVGETIFITSPSIWDTDDGERYIESRVIVGPVRAFTLMTDGVEKAAFLCNVYNEKKERFHDPNKPYPPFLEPNVNALLKLHEEGKEKHEINQLWGNFLDMGNERLRQEPDDKSMILGVSLFL
jgi:hypothetical protein